jgi:thiol-disulfide isomerase/thioredoxin
MKKILLLLCAIVIVACKDEPKVDYALFSGKVENAGTDKAKLKGMDFDHDISIHADGTFSDTLKLAETGFYSLSIGRENTTLYVSNGDNLSLNMDTKEFDESIKYTGEGAIENNYLVTKYMNNETSQGKSDVFFSLDEDAFKQKVETIKNSHLEALNGLQNADKDFVAIETKNLEYDRYSLLNSYEKSHAHYAKKEDFKVSDAFLPDALKNMAYDDAQAYKMSSSYKQMAFAKTLDGIFETIGDDYMNASTEQLKGISSIKIPALKNEVVSYLGSFLVSPANPNMTSVYEFFVANTTDDETKEKLKSTYEKGKDLVKGNPSPQFTDYENHKGGTTSLIDLKGKYVYIDVWATWCGPCKREIPSLKAVEKQFHGKNIEFVSTSIDVAKDHEAWVTMVNEKELGGIQLFADDNWKSKFVTDYGIQGIPRFILVDPNGNIVSADAPRPSDPKLVELFTELKI